MNIGVVIVGHNLPKLEIEQSIASLYKSEINNKELNFNVAVVETRNEDEVKGNYGEFLEQSEQILTIFPHEDFTNYARFNNIGIDIIKDVFGSQEYFVIANGNNIYSPDWMSNIILAMKQHKLGSASPFNICVNTLQKLNDKPVLIDYRLGYGLSDKCLVITDDTLNKIGTFVEGEFDGTTYVRQLVVNDIKHGLVTDSHFENVYPIRENNR